MKKILSLIVLGCLLVMPMSAKAAISFQNGFKCDKKVYETDGSATMTCYISANATSGSTLSQFTGTLQLENLTVKSITPASNWMDYSNGNSLSMRTTQGMTGEFQIATIVFTVNDVAKQCRAVLVPCYDENGEFKGCDSEVTVEETKSCYTDTANGVYYGKDGSVVTEEVYNSECVKNPQTGGFLPYAVIISGIVLAVGVFTITRKNNSLYKI